MAERTLVMGVLNVTPDSFSDGGQHLHFEDAVSHAERMIAEGVDIIDIGGESTRPGAERASEATELERVVPVVEALAGRGVQLSVDTMRASVARASLAAGAHIINDVSGGLADEAMFGVVAEAGADYVLMHWRDHSATMQQQASYTDVVAEVRAELLARRDAAVASGIAPERIILDLGFGFSKTGDHNWTLLAAQRDFLDLGHRVLTGVSRKRFLGELLASDDQMRPADERDDATLALTALCADQGVWAVRTHAVRPTRDAVEVVARLHRERG